MDVRRFDEMAREIGATRRGAMGWLAGGLGALIAAAPAWGEAKKRKRKKRKKGKKLCFLSYHVCPANERDCCGRQCCLAFGEPEGGRRYCATSVVTCCPAELGGGECPPETPVCCPDGTCGQTEADCFLGLSESSGRVVPRITHPG